MTFIFAYPDANIQSLTSTTFFINSNLPLEQFFIGEISISVCNGHSVYERLQSQEERCVMSERSQRLGQLLLSRAFARSLGTNVPPDLVIVEGGQAVPSFHKS